MYEKLESHYEIDKVDRDILMELMQDAKTPYTEIAKKLLISAGTVHVRMRKLEERGIVLGSVLQVNPENLGFDLSAFLGIHLEKGSQYEVVLEALRKIPEVTKAYYTTGAYSIFAKIYCRNTKHLYDLLRHHIQLIDGVQSTETLICLQEGINRQIRL